MNGTIIMKTMKEIIRVLLRDIMFMTTQAFLLIQPDILNILMNRPADTAILPSIISVKRTITTATVN